MGMWNGKERPEAPCLACLSCHGLMLCVGAQDVAIAHGYNNLRWTVPQTVTVGSELPLNQLTELMRLECAMAGFTEILTWALLSQAENFGHLQRQDDGATAVSIGNPATAEFEVCRTSLLPGAFRHPLMCVISELRDWTCTHMQRCNSCGTLKQGRALLREQHTPVQRICCNATTVRMTESSDLARCTRQLEC